MTKSLHNPRNKKGLYKKQAISMHKKLKTYNQYTRTYNKHIVGVMFYPVPTLKHLTVQGLNDVIKLIKPRIVMYKKRVYSDKEHDEILHSFEDPYENFISLSDFDKLPEYSKVLLKPCYRWVLKDGLCTKNLSEYTLPQKYLKWEWDFHWGKRGYRHHDGDMEKMWDKMYRKGFSRYLKKYPKYRYDRWDIKNERRSRIQPWKFGYVEEDFDD